MEGSLSNVAFGTKPVPGPLLQRKHLKGFGIRILQQLMLFSVPTTPNGGFEVRLLKEASIWSSAIRPCQGKHIKASKIMEHGQVRCGQVGQWDSIEKPDLGKTCVAKLSMLLMCKLNLRRNAIVLMI
ncbi:Uncharacterized protein Fot_01736 [Forsythia ovata]|uniref:Uncharacterized protein n=1 Tax=Forsythia ovata TaxID=205694 RepID=A0ABD1X599_9LAMI